MITKYSQTMKHFISLILVLLQVLSSFGQEPDSLMLLTQSQADSLAFRLKHHYTNNFNFLVKADTLMLVPRDDEMADTCFVVQDDVIAVAKIKEQDDTVWVKVARDQITMGWVTEEELLVSTTPDDGISVIIDRLTDTRVIWMSALVALGVIALLIYSRRQKLGRITINGSGEALMLMLTVLALVLLYTYIQTYYPEFWQEYYFHPTLNPLILPGIMAVLLSLVWAVIILYVAFIISVYHNFYFVPGMKFIFEITGISMLLYLTVSLTSTLAGWYVALVLAVIIAVCAVYIYFRYLRYRYQCPKCGELLRSKGTCPECGTKLV